MHTQKTHILCNRTHNNSKMLNIYEYYQMSTDLLVCECAKDSVFGFGLRIKQLGVLCV